MARMLSVERGESFEKGREGGEMGNGRVGMGDEKGQG